MATLLDLAAPAARKDNPFYSTADVTQLILSVQTGDDEGIRVAVAASICGVLLGNRYGGDMKRVIRRVWALALRANEKKLIPRRSQRGFWELMGQGVHACFKSGKMMTQAIAFIKEATKSAPEDRLGVETPVEAPKSAEFFFDSLVGAQCSIVFDCGAEAYSTWVVFQGFPKCLLPEIYVNGKLAKSRHRMPLRGITGNEEFCLDPFASRGRKNRVTFGFNSRMVDAVSCRKLEQATVTLEFREAGASKGPKLLTDPAAWYRQMDVASPAGAPQEEEEEEDDDLIFVMDSEAHDDNATATCPLSGESPVEMPVVSARCRHKPAPFGLVSFIETLRQKTTKPSRLWRCPQCAQAFTPADMRRFE